MSHLVGWCKILIHKPCKIAKSYWCPTLDLKLLHLLPVMQWVAIQDDSWAVKFYHACCWALDSHDFYHLPLLERNHILTGVSLSDILRLNSYGAAHKQTSLFTLLPRRRTSWQKQKDVTSQTPERETREQPPSTFLLLGYKTHVDFCIILCMKGKPYLSHGLKPSLCLSLSVLWLWQMVALWNIPSKHLYTLFSLLLM